MSELIPEQQVEVRLLASSKTWVEGAAIQQLHKTAELPGMRLAIGLPDLHPGKSSPIGAAFLVEGRIYPALVGNDIGCGIGLWKTTLSASRPAKDGWAEKLRRMPERWDGDATAWIEARGVAASGFEQSLGTIGSGNHFAEIQTVEEVRSLMTFTRLGMSTSDAYLLVHSGSRGFGEAVLREHVDQFRGEGIDADSEDAAAYLRKHDHAMRWAAANRELIAERILERLNASGNRILDVCHNWVERREVEGLPYWLHRKGAAPSTAGPLMIPGSRGAFSYLVAPLNPGIRSAFSLAHGAGRKWSRSDSRGKLGKRYDAKSLLRTELDSRVVCGDKDLLYEEAPQAYKKIETVISDLVDAGLIEVIAILRPAVTYKTGDGGRE